MVAPSPLQVSWVYSDEDATIARELLRLARVLELQGLIRNLEISGVSAGALLTERHVIHGDIAVFLVSPSAWNDATWRFLLLNTLREGGPRVVMVMVRAVPRDRLPEEARRLLLPKDGVPIAARKDRDDAMLEVIQALREIAAFRPSDAPSPGNQHGARDILPVNEIFRLNGPPTVTFVEPPKFQILRLELNTMGTGLIVEGPSKTGKSTAVIRAMDSLGVAERDRHWLNGRQPPALAEFQRLLDRLDRVKRRRWIFIDDFHYLEDKTYLRTLAFAMKALADQPRSHAKITLIGINPLGASLVESMPDLAGRFRIMQLDRERDWERSTRIAELIELGERAANIRFRRRDEFVVAAAGSFFIAQLLCNRAAVEAGVHQTQPATLEIDLGPTDVIASILGEFAAQFRGPVLHFAAWDATPPPRGAGLSLLWLLARSPDGFVSLNEARLRFPTLVPVFDWFLASNLSRCFEEHERLRGLLYFNRATGTLTMEDPRLRFYLRALDWREFAEASGHGRIVFHPDDGPLWPTDVPAGTPRTANGPAASGATPVHHLLHLSDLHFSTSDQATIAYSQLAADLRQQHVARLDALVISGDLVNRATPDEYEVALQFVEQLKSGFGIETRAIALVPGNHDVSWSDGDSAYRLVKRAQHRAPLDPGTYVEHGADVVEVRDDDAYRQRFAPFSEFYEKVKGEPYPLAYEDQATITSVSEAGLCILGLNSAWEIDRHFRDRASLNQQALSDALLRLPAPEPGELRIATFHHPIHSDEESRLRDTGFLQRLAVAGFRLILHGHVHRADAATYRYDRTVDGRQLDVITAGTFGAPVREWVPGYPLQYNLLLIRDRQITVETRRRQKVDGAREPDAMWQQGPGRDPLPRYVLPR